MFKAFLLLGGLFFLQKISFCQANPFMNDGNGRPLYMRTSYVAEGSPYLSEEYRLADITALSGKVYRNVNVRINFVDSQLEYIDNEGKELSAALPLQKIHFHIFSMEGKTIPNFTLQSVNESINAPGSRIFQLLDSGKCSLLKEIKITYKDQKKYGEATITRIFKKSESYVAFFPGKDQQLIKFDRNKTGVSSLFGDKQAKVSAFIDERKLSCKSDEDLIAVFNYYNSL